MNDQMNDACNCANCSGKGCECGCQAELATLSAMPPRCECGPACGCEAAEQGCLCA